MKYEKKYTENTCTNDDWIISRQKVLDMITGYLKPKPTDAILEIGCDDGFMQKTTEAIGIDVNKDALEINPFETYYMDAQQLRFEDKEFDKMYSSHTIEHIKNLLIAFQEAGRVLKRGGIYVVVYPWELFRGMAAMRSAMKVDGSVFKAREHHLHKLNPRKLDKYLYGTGLTQVKSRLFFANTPQYISILKKLC